MIKVRLFILFLFLFSLKYGKSQQIAYEGKLAGDDVFILKNIDNKEHRVKAYAVCLLDEKFQVFNDLRYFNVSDTLLKSDFKTIIWNKIPKGKYYLRFFYIIYSETPDIDNDENKKEGNELIISFIKE